MRVEFEDRMSKNHLEGVGAIPITRTNDNEYALNWVKKAKTYKPTQTVLSKFETKLPLKVTGCTESFATNFMKMFHYLPEQKVVARRICHLVTDSNNRTVAVLIWSNPLSPSLQERDDWIGWGKTWNRKIRLENINKVIANNVRFCVHPFITNRSNIASQCLRLSRELLIKDWKQKYDNDLIFLESLVDPEKYKGTCYLADNWKIIGQTKGTNYHGTLQPSLKFEKSRNWKLVSKLPPVSKKLIMLRELYPKHKTFILLKKLGLHSYRFAKS